jgi:biopolymer transport protein ExbB
MSLLWNRRCGDNPLSVINSVPLPTPIAIEPLLCLTGDPMFRKLSRFLAATAAAFVFLMGAAGHAPDAYAQSAPAVTATAASAATTAPDKIDNPYGLEALWKGSDAVAKIVLVMLLIMSMGSWYILVIKFIEQSKIMGQAKAAAQGFWGAGTVRQGADALDPVSPFRFIAEAGIEATKKHGGLLQHVDLNSWVTMSIQRAMERVQSRLQNGLAFLATVGSTAPFVGLFGTVWGIYHALTAIGIAGQASIDKVAGPVGEALIMTAIGLAVAVPAVLGYNWLVRRNKGAMDEVRAFGNELHSVLLSTTAAQSRG